MNIELDMLGYIRVRTTPPAAGRDFEAFYKFIDLPHDAAIILNPR